MRTSLPLALALTVSGLLGGHAVVAAPSACPPVIGERDHMLEVVQSMGLNGQVARLCKVPELKVQERAAAQMKTLKACLDERNIKDVDVQARLRAGAADGQSAYERSGAKEALCSLVRDQYAD